MSDKSRVKRGRPPTVDSDTVTNVILKYKNDILREDGGIVSKHDKVWTNIANELNHLKNERSLYTFVTCNKFDIRSKLTDNEHIRANDDNANHNNTIDSLPDESSTSLDLSHPEDKTAISFDIHVPKSDIEKLIITKVYTRKKSKKGPSIREYTKFRAGEWQDFLSIKIWSKTHSECGYNFKYHSISRDGASGHMAGQCDCGSTIKCFLQSDESDITTIKCTTTKGNGKCGKRYLRAPIRQAVAQELRHKAVCVYRAEKANELIREGDPEPPIIPKAPVLRNAKNEYAASFFLDRDPIKALHLMQLHAMKHVIQSISLSPFHVIYSTNHQNSVYRTYARHENACIAIDATGSIIKSILRPDKSKSKSIFLYICVIRSDFEGQLAVAQMLSERHHTNFISFWLREWIEKPGLPPPKEIVCDASKALVTAAIRAFTNFSTINDYADACKGEVMPSCYIRIDVAHFIKIYANFLKDLRPPVKKFYLASIGQLILSCDIERARKIVYAVLVVARSNTEGNMTNGELSPCEKEKTFLSEILTSEEEETLETSDDQAEETDETEPESLNPSEWFEWALDIDRRVRQQIELADGLRINAHYFPALADRLLRDLKWLPLWSCIVQNKFGYGRIPASSAPVESEFKNIKVHLLKGENLPMRVDQFVAKHIEHVNGITKLAEAAATATRVLSPELVEEDDPRCLEIMPQNEIEQSEQSACPACANGDEPGGAHICYVCGVSVHAFDLCSSPFHDDEEGYGQRRICMKCQTQKNVPDIVASRQFENWGGLAEPEKQKTGGRYLKKKYADNEFILDETIRKVPILKNGGNVALKSVALGKENFTLENTCAFDSVFHIFLTAASDLPRFRTSIENLEQSFFQMVNKVLKKGVNATSYRLRCELLLPIFEKSSSHRNCTLLRCEITVADLCRKLFKATPSFQEESICDRDCSITSNALPISMITLASVLDASYNVKIEQEVTLTETTKCSTDGCTGNLVKSLKAPGNFIIFEVVPADGTAEDDPVMLRDIPTTLQLSFMSAQYVLAGIVHFKKPSVETRSSYTGLIKSVGHYVAMCHRKGAWIEIDDTKNAAERRTNKRKVYLHLLIYVR